MNFTVVFSMLRLVSDPYLAGQGDTPVGIVVSVTCHMIGGLSVPRVHTLINGPAVSLIPCTFPCWHIYLKSHVSKCVIISI